MWASWTETDINYRQGIQAIWDASSWVIALLIATFLRYDGNPDTQSVINSLVIGVILGVVQVVLSWVVQGIRGRRIIGSFDEISVLTFSAAGVTLLGTLTVFIFYPAPIPRSVPFIAGAFALTFMLGGRFTLRALRQRSIFSHGNERVLIYGAGEGGNQIIRQMLATPSAKFTPVALIDDDPRKKNLRIHGVRVVGSSEGLEQVIRRTGTSTLVVAIAGIDSKQLLKLDQRCKALNVDLRVIPTTSEIIGGAIKLGDISHVTDEDLLGRRQIQADEAGILEMLREKRILITGAGGSIGSELARQVYRYQPAFVGILDRDESAIHATQLSIDGQALLDSDNLILADIRDREWIREVIISIKPDIIFHAAALKHLPLLERYPEEGHKTNVIGTRNVLEAAQECNVNLFINISTDKAADPSCVLGRTKLMTERMTAGIQSIDGERYISVRFGNVLGSRGSVLTAFRHQIANGGPVTVTDPEVTRYFMTIPEAVHLVLQAAVIGAHSETLILDMGEPIKIDDVAKQMIRQSGREISIVYTGLRAGEKSAEVLFASSEVAVSKSHPLIFHTKVEAINIHQETGMSDGQH